MLCVNMKHLLLCTVLLVASAFTSPAGVREDFLQETLGLRKTAQALDEEWHRRLPLLVQDRKPPAVGQIVRLKLGKAIYTRDLHVALYRFGDEWIRAFAWASDYNNSVHGVDPAALKITGNAGKGTLSGVLTVRLVPDGIVPLDGVERRFQAVIQGEIQQGTVSGKYSTRPLPRPPDPPEDYKHPPSIPAGRGVLGGRAAVWPAAPAPPEVPHIRLAARSLYQVYAEARRLEREAMRRYQMIRAIDLARAAGGTYGEAMRAAFTYMPERPAFDPPDVAKAKKNERSGPSIDDLDMDLEDEVDAGDEKKARAADGSADPLAGKTLEVMREMRRRADTLLAFAKASPTDSTRLPNFLTVGETVQDPDFGPWYGEKKLPYDEKTGVTRLPAYAPDVSVPQWPCIAAWQMIGPFVNTSWEAHTPLLPEILHKPAAAYRIDLARSEFHRKYYKSSRVLSWELIRPNWVGGIVCPPNVSRRNRIYWRCPRAANSRHSGIEYSTTFARAVLDCEADATYWVEIGVCQRGKLWINDRLFWVSPRFGRYEGEQKFFLQLPLKRGRNTLLLRCDVDYASPYFWMRVCTAGRPRSADEYKRRRERIVAAIDARRLPRVSGWRGMGNGLYPDAKPPIAWDIRKKHNLLWRTPLRYWSNSSPVIAGDRVIVAVEPDLLVCLRKSDGKVLWERNCNRIDLLPEAERKEGWRLYNEWWSARQARDAVPVSVMEPAKWVKNSAGDYWTPGRGIWAAGEEKDEREGASPKLIALLDRRDELRKAEDPEAIADELTKVEAQIKTAKAEAKADDPAVRDAKAKQDALNKATGALRKFMEERGRWGGRGGYWYDMDGRAFPTPVTDGKHVWWKNGTGVAGCFDMDGNRIWLARTHGAQYGNDAISSPRLIGDKLICEVPNHEAERGRPKGMRYIAFDKKTGEIVWEAKRLRRSGWGCATMTWTTLSDGETMMDVIITPGGSVIRADDGYVLIPHTGHQTHDASPDARGDLVVFPRAGMNVVQLLMKSRDVVGAKRLWYHRSACDYGGIVLAGDYIHFGGDYRLRGDSTPSEFCQRVTTYHLLDAGPVSTVPLYRKSGKTYGLPFATDAYLYINAGEGTFMPTGGKMCYPKPPHQLTVTTREGTPIRLAVNAIERTYSQAVPDGDRLYLRGYQSMICVGYTGESGRTYENVTVARTLLDQVQAARPKDGPAIEPKPTRGAPKSAGVPYIPAHDGLSPGTWLCAGPFHLSAAGKGAKIFSKDAFIKAETPVSIGGTDRVLQAFSTRNFEVKGFPRYDMDRINFTQVLRHRRVVDVGPAFGDKAPCVVYLYSAITCEKPGTFRFELTAPGAGAWIGGIPVANGQRVSLDKGAYALLIELKIEKVPEEGLLLSPCFWASDDVAEEEKKWLTFVQRFRPRFQAAIDSAPDTPTAARAKKVLGGL